MLCVMRLTHNRSNSINSILYHGHVVRKSCHVVSTASFFPYVMLCLNVMTVKREGTMYLLNHKELQQLKNFLHVNLLLLKSSQNKRSNIKYCDH